MPKLLIVGGGLFGSQAAAYTRSKGMEAVVFDAALPGAASPAAAGLFRERWVTRKWLEHYTRGMELLDRLFGIETIHLSNESGVPHPFLFVPPRRILEANPVRANVTAIGDGWLEANGVRHEGFVYVAAGVWSATFDSGLQATGKAGAAFLFAGESPGRIHDLAYGKQALAFPRDPGVTYFSDGTAEETYTTEHDDLTLRRAADLGLKSMPVQRLYGIRPYTSGGPVFKRLGEKTWLGTGGRKMGTLFGASLARRLIEEELRLK